MSVNSNYLFLYLEKNNSLEALTKHMQLTPLHLAVIEKSKKSVRKLLEGQADVNARDIRKWTPLHHATALGYEKIIKLLYIFGADPKALSDTQITASELGRFVLLRNKKSEETIPLLTTLPDNTGLSLLTYRQYHQLTGTDYLLEPFIPKHYLIKEWRQGLLRSESLPFIGQIQEKYEEFLLQPRIPHILEKAVTNDQNQQLLSSPGLGLFASQDYHPGVIIGEYLGRVSDDNPRSSYTLAGPVDGSQYSNELTRINDGFPNVVLVPLANIHGLSKRYIFITSSPIKKGDQFCWNYGEHSVKLGPYSEMRPAAMRKYIQEVKEWGTEPLYSNFEYLITKLVVGLGITQQISLEEFMEVEKLRYLLETPAAFFNLVFEGFLDDSTAHRLWQAAYFPACLISQSAPKELSNLVTIAIEARNYYRTMQSQDPLKAREFQTAIVENIAKKGILATLSFVASARLERPMNNHPRKDQIGILIGANSNKRKGIFGIGRKLTTQDLGKRVVRTAPSFGKVYDWSYVPDEPTANAAMKNFLLLLKDEGTTFICQGEIDRLLSLNTCTKISDEKNDGNWMLLEDYQEFVEEFPLDQFPQEKEIADEQDTMACMRDDELLRINSWSRGIFEKRNKRHMTVSPTNHYSKTIELLSWVKKARQQLPALQENHFFKVAQEAAFLPSAKISSQEQTARRILEISYDEHDPKKITKQFHKLALHVHPDKGGDPLQFKKLNDAYHLVLKKLDQRQVQFKIEARNSQELSLEEAEEIYEETKNYFNYLKEELRTSSREAKIVAWEKYYFQIMNLTSLKVPEGDGFFEEVFKRLVGNVREHSLYLKFRQKLEGLEKEFLHQQDNSSEKVAKLENLIKLIIGLEEEFDLSNQRSSWIILEQPFFRETHLLFQDRVMAFERTLAEIYLRQECDKEASEVCLRAQLFHSEQSVKIQAAIIRMNAKDFLRNLKKHSTEKPSDKAESEQKKMLLQESSFEKKTEKTGEERDNFEDIDTQTAKEEKPFKKELITLLSENIAKNLKFFAQDRLDS